MEKNKAQDKFVSGFVYKSVLIILQRRLMITLFLYYAWALYMMSYKQLVKFISKEANIRHPM